MPDQYTVRFTRAAHDDLTRLHAFLLDYDLDTADRALDAMDHAWAMLARFLFSCRKAEHAPSHALLREIIIPFGASGYVALFEITDASTVTVLAVRHQRENDYL